MNKPTLKQLNSRHGVKPLVNRNGLPKGILIDGDYVELLNKRFCPDQIRKKFNIRRLGVTGAFNKALLYFYNDGRITMQEMVTMSRCFHDWLDHHHHSLAKKGWL